MTSFTIEPYCRPLVIVCFGVALEISVGMWFRAAARDAASISKGGHNPCSACYVA